MPLQIESGTWNGRPNHQCPFCSYSTISRLADVHAHIRHRHPDQLRLALLEDKESMTKTEAKEAAKGEKPEQPAPEPTPVSAAAEGGEQ